VVIRIEDLECRFGESAAVDGVSLDVDQGDLVALIGPSGCGKSTLLRCLNGLEILDAGQVRIFDVQLKPPAEIGVDAFRSRAFAIRQGVGMVFQSFNLFPHLTVLQNVTLAQRVVRRVGAEEAEQKARELLTKVGLSEKADQFPEYLSGGQKQRAAIARALAMSPKVLLYDEPTSALDPTLVGEVLRVMKQLDMEGMTQIVVTHELRFAREVADRVVFLERGKIVEMGTPQEVFGNPKDERTRAYLRHFL
jgi:polar amino acid transport system ATP-binding protein